MVNIYCAYTAPINDASASDITVTRAQCWAGLQRKVRNAPEFVGAIATCKVLSEDEADGTVTRVVTFKADPEKEVKEVCRGFWPMKVCSSNSFLLLLLLLLFLWSGEAKTLLFCQGAEARSAVVEATTISEKTLVLISSQVDFHQTDGSVISNIISDGPSGKPEDLFMTYAFQWLCPDVKEGGDEEKELRKKYEATAKMAVDKSIEAIRRFVEAGEL